MTSLSELADAVEELEGPSHAIDMRIVWAAYEGRWPLSCYNNEPINYDPTMWMERHDFAPTASLDAALTLVPKGWWWKVGECSISSDATVGPDFAHCPKDMLIELDDGIDATIEPPSSTAIALTAACLRAHDYLRASRGKG